MDLLIQNTYHIAESDRTGDLTFCRIYLDDELKDRPAEHMLKIVDEEITQMLKDLKPMIMMRVLEELVIRKRSV